MRRRATCALALCLLLAGCGGGGSDDAPTTTRVKATGTAPPAPTPEALAYASGAREALRGGAIGVADFTYHVAVEPSRMEINREQQLSELRWSGWGSERATGRADVRTLICEPTCAQGTYEESTAVIVLSAPRRCDGQRFYTRSSMTYEEAGKTRAPATYLRTPC